MGWKRKEKKGASAPDGAPQVPMIVFTYGLIESKSIEAMYGHKVTEQDLLDFIERLRARLYGQAQMELKHDPLSSYLNLLCTIERGVPSEVVRILLHTDILNDAEPPLPIGAIVT